MKRSDIDQTPSDERDVEHVLQALTAASGVEAGGEVQVLEVNQDTGIIRFIANNIVVRTLATALNYSGDLVRRAIYRAIPTISSSSTTADTDGSVTTSDIMVDGIVETDEDETLSEVSTSSAPTSTESIVANLSDRQEDDDDHVEEVVVLSTDPLDEYVSELNVEALASKARESGALVVDSALGRVFTPNAMHELGIDGMQPVTDSHGLYSVSHTTKSSRGVSRQQSNAELAGQVLAHPESVAAIIRGTRGPISSAEEADELGDVDVEPLDGNVFDVSTTGNTVTTTFNLFAFLQLLSLHCTSALTTPPVIAQVIGSDVDSYTVHLEILKNYVGAELAELIFNPKVGMDGQIELTPVMLPQVHHDEAVDTITPKSLFSIAIDTSGSMDKANQVGSYRSKLDVAKEKLKATIAKLTSSTPDWTIVLTKFDSDTSVLGIFNSSDSTPEDMYLVIDRLSADGYTRLYGTASEQLEYIMKLASSGHYTHFASILFTDGHDNASDIGQLDVITTAGSATDAVDNLQIFTLELGSSNHQFFTQMSLVSGCTHIPLSDMSDLSAFDGYIRLLSKDTSVVRFLTEAFETFSRMVALEGEITVGNTIIRPDAKFEVNKVLHCIAAPETTLAEIHDGIFLTELRGEDSLLSGESSRTHGEDLDGYC